MHNDKLHFDIHELPSGITVYSHSMDVPFFALYLQGPVGSVHSHTGNPGGAPGIAHLMEHMLFHRSTLYPEKDSFERRIRLSGSYWNATTFGRHTEVYVEAPVRLQQEVTEGLFDHFINPIFTEEDLAIERAIVANERNQRRYYPASTELDQYLDTQWMNDIEYPKEQVFGTDEDLAETSVDMLSTFIKTYAVPGMRIIVGGGHTLAPILDLAAQIQTTPLSLTSKLIPISWHQKAFHTHEFAELDAPVYYLGGFTPEYDFEDEYALSFALVLLTNSVHGPLYKWIRDEKGWSYGPSQTAWRSTDRTGWRIKIPVNTEEQVTDIRREIHDRMRAACSDTNLIAKEADRRKNNDVFAYQTLDSRMGAALYALRDLGEIRTQQDYLAQLAKCSNPTRMMEIYEMFFSPSASGEFLALPKKGT